MRTTIQTFLLFFVVAIVIGAQERKYPLNLNASVTAGTAVEIIPVPTGSAANRTIYIGWIFFAWDNSASFTISYGTGTTCGTGTVVAKQGGAATNFDFYPGAAFAPIAIPPGRAVCLTFSTSVTGKGSVSYAN